MVSIPSGPEQEMRDDAMRKEKEYAKEKLENSMDDEYLQTIWEEFQVYVYDAFDEVESWWVEWGSLLDRVNEETQVRPILDFFGNITVERRASFD